MRLMSAVHSLLSIDIAIVAVELGDAISSAQASEYDDLPFPRQKKLVTSLENSFLSGN